MSRRVVISGCSGGGKSTLIEELARRGHSTIMEPGRRVVRQQSAVGGNALPWRAPEAFLHHALALAQADAEGCGDGLTFFDRGLVDAAIGLEHLTGNMAEATLAQRPRYDRQVFLVPPWPEIYVTDAERRHGFVEAAAEYERLRTGYPRLGYEVSVLPKVPVAERAEIVLALLKRLPRDGIA